MPDVTDTKAYVLAGNATFTLYSAKLDKRYTYKVQRDKSRDDRYYAKVLIGQDNENDYRYIGLFYSDTMDLRVKNAPHTAPQYTMLRYFLQILQGIHPWPNTCQFLKSNRCCACGRLLTTPESIVKGIGPECERRRYL